MTELSEQRLAEITALIGDVKPATDQLLVDIAEQVRGRREHDHSGTADWDWFCLNASGWLGDRMPVVLRRLLDAEARVTELEAERDEERAQRQFLGRDVERLRAQVAEMVRAAMGDREVRLFDDVGEVQHVRSVADAQLSRANTLDRLTREHRERADRAEARVAELEGAGLTVFRASFPESGITLHEYFSRAAAMDHVHGVLANEENTTPQAIELRVIWRADDPEADEPVWECWLHGPDGEDDKPTGHVVGPVTVAAAYDAEADE